MLMTISFESDNAWKRNYQIIPVVSLRSMASSNVSLVILTDKG